MKVKTKTFSRNLISLALLAFLIAMANVTSFSQGVKISDTGGTNPEVSSMLEVESTTKGLLIPRMTTAQRNAIGSPVSGLLVYDTDVTAFYYYEGGWIQIGGGGSCSTLDQAYDCGGAGVGRTITADNGAVEINLPVGGANTDAIFATTAKGSAVSPTSAVSTLNSAYGAAIYGETTNASNDYSTIQGVVATNTNSSSSTFPSGVAGYYDGTGIGVGVWGECSGNGASSGAGIYGKGNNNNFGGWLYSSSYPGLMCETNNSGAAAAQIVSQGTSYTNPSILSVGWSQFDCSSNASCHSILINNLGTEPTIAPQTPGYGYLGTSGTFWYQIYAYQFAANDDYYYFDTYDDLSLLNSIKGDTLWDPVLGHHIMRVRPKTIPRCVTNYEDLSSGKAKNQFVFLTRMDGLLIGAARQMDKETKERDKRLAARTEILANSVGVDFQNASKAIKKTINDFGKMKSDEDIIFVVFSEEFKSKLKNNNIPVVNITPTSNYDKFYVSDVTSEGFTVTKEGGGFSFNWTAITNIQVETKLSGVEKIDDIFYKEPIKITKSYPSVDYNFKKQGLSKENKHQQELLKMKEPNNINPKNSKRYSKEINSSTEK